MIENNFLAGLHIDVLLNEAPVIFNAITTELEDHEKTGWFLQQERHFLGVSRDLKKIFLVLRKHTKVSKNEFELTTRMSCVNKNFSETVISFYLFFKPSMDRKKRVCYQMSWLTDEKNIVVLKKIIRQQFEASLRSGIDFTSESPKFGEGFGNTNP